MKKIAFAVKTRFDDDAKPHAELQLNSKQGYLGPVLEDHIPYITTGSRPDFIAAFNKRANYHSNERVHPSLLRHSRVMNRRLVPHVMPTVQWDRDLFESWLANFDTEKRLRIERAYHDAGLDKLFDYSSKQIFTKIEALVKDHDTVAGRLIFKGTDLYNMLSGPIFKVMMQRFCDCENSLRTTKFKISYKQQTPEIVEHLESICATSFIECDFSSNDKTQVRDVQRLELDFMARLGCPSWFLKLHAMTNRFAVYSTKFGFMSDVSNQLPSGCTDGTFRNTYWNLAIFNSWCLRMHVTGSRSVFLGDDMLAALPKRIRRGARSYTSVASLGQMTAKVSMRRVLNSCHFLSKNFYPVNSGENAHVMLPFVPKTLAKFNTRPNSNAIVDDDEYMAGKSLSHAYEFRFSKILRDVFLRRARMHLTVTRGRFSLEGVSYHVRRLGQYDESIYRLLNFDTWPDLVKRDDLDDYWQTYMDLCFGEVMRLFHDIVLLDTKHIVLPCDMLGDF